MTYSIVYLSASKALLDEAALGQVIRQSRENNALSGITGVLLYCNGSIIQVLEGEEGAVTTVFGKIKNDPRHTQIITLFKDQVEERLFDKWSMGYFTMDTRNMEELKEQLLFVNNPHVPVETDNKILSLLQTFFKNNYRN